MADLSARAISVLASVDAIAAEDTRHSARLLDEHKIATPRIAYHDFNETAASEKLLQRIASGESIALISDAGTPLIADPGYRIVQGAHQQGIKVVPVPGASALVAALSSAGLATDEFFFTGFLPAKRHARLERLAKLSTWVHGSMLRDTPSGP